ncbi:MAG: hypothetical protein ACOCTN_01775, partial [Candidatus Natronoplasma sp.]
MNSLDTSKVVNEDIIGSQVGLMDFLRNDKIQAVIGIAIFASMIIIFEHLATDVTQAHQYYGLALLFLAI